MDPVTRGAEAGGSREAVQDWRKPRGRSAIAMQIRWLGRVFAVWILVRWAVWGQAIEETDDAFLQRLQRAAFEYFWKEANSSNGLVRDRSRPDSKCSIAAVGFGLSAVHIGIER